MDRLARMASLSNCRWSCCCRMTSCWTRYRMTIRRSSTTNRWSRCRMTSWMSWTSLDLAMSYPTTGRQSPPTTCRRRMAPQHWRRSERSLQ